MRSSIEEAFAALDEAATLQMVEAQLEAGQDPLEVVAQCRRGMTAVGERFGSGEYYLSELVLAANIFEECSALIEPRLAVKKTGPPLGTVVIGTVKGDIHDLGKNIVALLLRCEGFQVLDLGVDVPPDRFVQAIAESGAPIMGMSCLLTTAFAAMKDTIQAVEQAGMRRQTYILIGGGPVDERVRAYVGADFCARDAIEGLRACHEHLGDAPHGQDRG
jgi:methanogenic corrinoid protein MtbC1